MIDEKYDRINKIAEFIDGLQEQLVKDETSWIWVDIEKQFSTNLITWKSIISSGVLKKKLHCSGMGLSTDCGSSTPRTGS